MYILGMLILCNQISPSLLRGVFYSWRSMRPKKSASKAN